MTISSKFAEFSKWAKWSIQLPAPEYNAIASGPSGPSGRHVFQPRMPYTLWSGVDGDDYADGTDGRDDICVCDYDYDDYDYDYNYV